jgi:T4 RnlA family RNA ligase
VENKLYRYLQFIKEGMNNDRIPTYEECVEMCGGESPFYEMTNIVDGYTIKTFNYRLAQASDFDDPKSREMRGITFVFNKNGSLYKRYILLEKFFNLNQVPTSMYSVVKNYKIKSISNKEDGSIASFIKLPNGRIVGKSKMGFDNQQALGINRVYKFNSDIQNLVNWTLDNDLMAIFEYVSPSNRIVLRYTDEELILLRIRDNRTGVHVDIREHMDKVGSIRIAPFEDDYKDLDNLIEINAGQIDKEGSVVHATDEDGNDFFYKVKTPWYCALHGLLTDDLYRENILINYILEDKIDDILGQIPEEQPEAHERINKMINVVRREITDKIVDIRKAYDYFLKMGENKKEYAMKHLKDPNFHNVMALDKGKRLSKMSDYEIAKVYDTYEDYEASVKRCDIHELAKADIRNKTDRLLIAREWLKKRDPSLFFVDPEENDDDN